MMSAVLSNPGHPEYGVATIPFPIPHDQHTHCMELLEALEIRRRGQGGLQGGKRSTASTPSSSEWKCSRSMWMS